MANPANAGRLAKTFANAPLAAHPQRWDALYRDDFKPWDRAGPSLALADLIATRPDLVPPAQDLDSRGNPLRTATGAVSKRTALVPGCGAGHDVLLLARFGYDVWGLDYSKTAVALAKETEKKAGKLQPWNEEVVECGKVTWVSGDFFEENWAKGAGTDGTGKFDLVFDYTFFCALPVSARPQWAQRMCSLVAPKGHLVCLEFPSGKPLSDDGPPWGVAPEVYEAHLSAPGDPVEYDDKGSVISTPSPKPRDHGLHRLSLIKPTRTHAAGTNEDGSVRDFISVWT